MFSHPGGAVVNAAGGGRGAMAPRDSIEASDKDELATALIATGFAFDPALRTRQGETLTKILARVRDIRRSGSASIDLLSLAAGTVDAYYEGGLSPWDVAGGAVIAEEAGATVLRSTVDGYPGIGLIGANPRLLESLATLLRDAGFALDAS